MIVVVGRVTTDAARRNDLIAAGQRVASASRQEPGCVSYKVFEDIQTPNDFVFVEEWRDEDALQEHFRTPHIAEFMQAVPNAIVRAPEVKFHQVASTRDLSEVTAG